MEEVISVHTVYQPAFESAYACVVHLVLMATTKKAVAKKVAPVAKQGGGKAAPKKDHSKSKRVLVSASGEQCFWVNNGAIISNLLELRDALDRMTDDVFGYHVTRGKNDFADWVEYVLGDTELAGKLRSAKKPKSARTVVVSRLKIYDI